MFKTIVLYLSLILLISGQIGCAGIKRKPYTDIAGDQCELLKIKPDWYSAATYLTCLRPNTTPKTQAEIVRSKVKPEIETITYSDITSYAAFLAFLTGAIVL